MEAPFLVRGDPLPEVSPLETSGYQPSRGLFWGLNLTQCRTRKQARAEWHDAIEKTKAELDAHPAVRRLCIGCSRPRQFRQNALVRVPDGLALRLHNDLERDRGRYVCVTVLDITGCDDPALLQVRLREALAQPVMWSDLTIAWSSIADTSLAEAWAGNTL